METHADTGEYGNWELTDNSTWCDTLSDMWRGDEELTEDVWCVPGGMFAPFFVTSVLLGGGSTRVTGADSGWRVHQNVNYFKAPGIKIVTVASHLFIYYVNQFYGSWESKSVLIV